jgi:hypothetical protein
MKYPDLNKWKYNPDLEGLLLFAQLVEELLFDFTIDTYKVPAMNSHGLSDELYQTISEVESGAIKLGAIKPIREELCDRLTKDHVAISILGSVRDALISCLNRNDSIAEIKVRAELLKNKLDNEYLAENKKLLKETLADIRQKEKIISITKTLVTELINIGYSQEYIYFETINFFFAGRFPSVIDNISLIDDYLGQFLGKELDFIAVFRVSENFNQLKDFVEDAGMKIQSDVPSIRLIGKATRATNFLSKNESLPLYLIIDNIKACDVFSAREDGDIRIQLLDSLARYHVHRQDFNWSDEAIICDKNNRSLGVYKKPVAATLKRPEPDINRLSGLIGDTLSTVTSGNLKEESFSRIIRAFMRHDIAVKAEAPESQLLELWAAIEVLFTTYENGEEKILQIAKSIVLFETTEYAAKVATDLYFSIKNSGKAEALEVINEIEEGSNEIEKCLALVSIQDNEEKRDKLYEMLQEHVLLRNRIFYMQNKMSSADLIRKMLIAHDRRVTWQIHRIYRARNLYIHSGKSLQYIKILVENLHSYLDRVLDVLIERIELTEHPTDIDQICLDIKLGYDAHLKLLEKANAEVCTRDNYKVLLFGH